MAVYDHWLIHDDSDLQVLFMPQYTGADISFGTTKAIENGGAMVWYLFPGKWYDIGSFFLADGTQTGWYTNFCTPVKADGDKWFATDLFLDHWTSIDGHRMWLDEDEYADAVSNQLITTAQQGKVEAGRQEVAHRLEGPWPPEVVKPFTLKRVLCVLGENS